jgi:hypothetical protein
MTCLDITPSRYLGRFAQPLLDIGLVAAGIPADVVCDRLRSLQVDGGLGGLGPVGDHHVQGEGTGFLQTIYGGKPGPGDLRGTVEVFRILHQPEPRRPRSTGCL